MAKFRHGPEGADIIKDSGSDQREKFLNLGFSRSDIVLMSDLIRFHDYLAMVGTGEVSYQIFSEVLYPISNISLFRYPDTFLDQLLLLNIADFVGSIGKLNREDFTIIMHDFAVVKRAHDNISKKLYNNLVNISCSFPMDDLEMIHKETISFRTQTEIIPELQRLTETHTSERLRRLLRNGFRDLAKEKKFEDYEKKKGSVGNQGDRGNRGNRNQFIDPKASNWFIRNDEINDIMPIVACLRDINVKQDFYTRFAFICKLDYMLGFLKILLKKVVDDGIADNNNRDPHDLRLDLAMTVVELINMLVESYGDFTSNNTKIGLGGFDRLKDLNDGKKILERLSGKHGRFKEAEAFAKLRNVIVIWVIAP
ncbi:hypothetical protein [Methanothrix sp.]|jgi:hypothetical protein|uniref:hypothetical protein n=1 Tax=Methanothrix sp. TaxID=90426 RepID=UPI001BD38A15